VLNVKLAYAVDTYKVNSPFVLPPRHE
jgi:hypothetical protein